MKRLLIILGILLAVFVAVAAIGSKQGWIGGEDLTKVAVKTADQREIVGMVSASGKIYPEAEVKISPDVPGEIVELYVQEGDSVKQGQLLLKIRPDDYTVAIDRSISGLNTSKASKAQAQARLEQAQAQMANAKSELDRSQNLYNSELISKQEFDRAKLAYNSSQSDVNAARESVQGAQYNISGAATEVNSARRNYQKTILRAPSSGIISQLNVEKGERVVGTSQMAGTEMLTIANLKDMECRIEVSENDIVRVNLGDSCNIEVDAYYGKVFKGVVTQISNSLQGSAAQAAATTGQVTNFEVTVNILPESYTELQDKRFPFRPGMSATVDIITERVNDKLTVPIQSVTARSEEDLFKMQKDTMSYDSKKDLDKDQKRSSERLEYVFVVNNGETALKAVKTGIQDDEYIIIEEGLSPGDSVISAPYTAISKKLKLGEKVEIVDADEVYKEN